MLPLGWWLKPLFWQRNWRAIRVAYAAWFLAYAVFIIFFTGPSSSDVYPKAEESPYHLPWNAGVTRFVAQGNRSYTSHRDLHLYAWDFVMPNGTPVLAARAGTVIAVEDSFDGIGLRSNYLWIEHDDGTRAGYAHIRHRSSLVAVSDKVKQGQPIAWSGMVGQTTFPHLHFYVLGKDRTASIPISFQEVAGGIPLAGRLYTSENTEQAGADHDL